MPCFTMSLRWITPSTRRAVRRRRAACRRWSRCRRRSASSSSGTSPPCSSTQRRTESAAPLRIDRPSKSTPLMRVCAVNGTSSASGELARREAVALLGERDDRAALGRLVGQAREQRGVGERRARSTPGSGRNSRGLPVAVGDRAGLVEQQRRAVARRLDRAAATSRARCAARAGPCPRCRWPTAARRSSSGSGTRAARPAR